MRDRSRGELLGSTLLAGAKRASRTLAEPLLAVARASRLFPLARGATSADEALSFGRRAGNVEGAGVDLSEPPRALTVLEAGDPPPHTRPVTTTVTMLDGSRGAFVFCDNHIVDQRAMIVAEHATDERGRPFTFRRLRPSRAPLERPLAVDGTVAFLSNTGVHNVGHWYLFVYPLVQHYRDYLGADPDYYYLGEPVRQWHYDSLAALGIGADQVLTRAVSGERMLAAVADRALPPPTSFLDFSTNALRKPRAEPRRRIYISRALQPRRRSLLNEAECLEVLHRHGFEEYRTETLTLDEATDRFASADAVVALTGAGLANLLFCHAGCVAIELFPHGYTNSWFAEVSAARGHVYGTLLGEPTKTLGLQPNEYHAIVDVAKLDAVLAAADEHLAERRRQQAPAPGPDLVPADGR
jgi:hypothetical protein